MSLEKSEKYRAGTRNVCFEDLNKDICLKSKMKHVVKYDVYLDILLMGSMYVIQSTILRKTHFRSKEIFKRAAQFTDTFILRVWPLQCLVRYKFKVHP